MALGTAFRAFFAALFDREMASRLREVLNETSKPSALPEPTLTTPTTTTTPAATVATSPASSNEAGRSEAVALLAVLQREARFVDLLQENLDAYADAQVGAAARPCLQQCRTTIERLLALRPLVDAQEGSPIQVPENASAAAYQWIGEGSGTNGQLVHHGWKATCLELPAWTGLEQDRWVIAAAQVKR